MSDPVTPIRVLIVDDHAAVRRGIRHLLGAVPDIEIAGEAASGNEALQIVSRVRPDVILLDVRMPGLTGYETAPRLLEAAPGTRIIMLTTYDEDEYIAKSFGGGAVAYLLKNSSDDTVVEAIRAAHRGERVVTPELMDKVLAQYQSLARTQARIENDLSAEDVRILQMIKSGATNERIARAMFLGERTLKRRVQGIYRKLGVAHRLGAIAEASRRGLI